MATRPQRELKIGDIIDKTVDVVGNNAVGSLIFIAIIAAAGTVVDLYARQAVQQGLSVQAQLQSTALSLLLAVVTIIATYLLIEGMLKNSGLMSYTGDKRILAFVGMSLLLTIGVVLGLILLIIPGLVFAARWSIASPLLVGKGEGVMASLGKSWEATKGHELSIILASLIMLVLFYCVAILPPFLFSEITLVVNGISRIGGAAANVISAAMSVAIYGLLSARNVSGTFE